MSQAAEARHQGIPRGVLIGAAALLSFTLALTWFARSFDVGELHMPAVQPYRALSLNFIDDADGGVDIVNAATGATLSRVAPGTGGFVRGALRGFAQERLRDGAGKAAPFTLTRWRDGTLSLQDGATGRRIDLDAFGPTQAQTFAKLFVAEENAK